jgi:hypothetical protein
LNVPSALRARVSGRGSAIFARNRARCAFTASSASRSVSHLHRRHSGRVSAIGAGIARVTAGSCARIVVAISAFISGSSGR